MSQISRRTLILLALAALAMVVALAPLAPAAFAQAGEEEGPLGRLLGRSADEPSGDAGSSTLRVSGTGRVSVVPDRAVVRLGVETTGDDVAAALEANSEITEAVIETLVDLGVGAADIETGHLAITPIEVPRDQPDEGAPATESDRSPTPSFRIVDSVTVTVDEIERVGEIIEAGVLAGANLVHGLEFTVREPLAFRAAALEGAVRAAALDAAAVAGALDAQIVRVIEVRALDSGGPPVVAAPMALGAVGGAPPIRPGELTIGATVELTLEVSGATLPALDEALADAPDTDEANTEGDEPGEAEEIEPVDVEPVEEGDAYPGVESAASGAGTTAAGEETVPESAAGPGSGLVAIEPVVQATMARYRGRRPRAVVATSAAAWERNLAPLLPDSVEVAVDWEREIIAAVFLGQKTTGGHAIKIDRATVEDGKLVLFTVVTEPTSDTSGAAIVTSPFQLVRVPRAELPDDVGEDLTAEMRPLSGP